VPDPCPSCGKDLALVGRAHNCKPAVGATLPPDTSVLRDEAGDVNEVNTPQEAQLTPPIPKKRGEYPDTDERRKYMREYMMKKRRGKL
jgi:hypothetical protein